MPISDPGRGQPTEEFRVLFTEDEVRDGLARVLPDDVAETMAHAMFTDIAANTVAYGELLSTLSLVSPDCAGRVRRYLGEDASAEAARLADFRQRVQLR
jgi:hypothetical protein